MGANESNQDQMITQNSQLNKSAANLQFPSDSALQYRSTMLPNPLSVSQNNLKTFEQELTKPRSFMPENYEQRKRDRIYNPPKTSKIDPFAVDPFIVDKENNAYLNNMNAKHPRRKYYNYNNRNTKIHRNPPSYYNNNDYRCILGQKPKSFYQPNVNSQMVPNNYKRAETAPATQNNTQNQDSDFSSIDMSKYKYLNQNHQLLAEDYYYSKFAEKNNNNIFNTKNYAKYHVNSNSKNPQVPAVSNDNKPAAALPAPNQNPSQNNPQASQVNPTPTPGQQVPKVSGKNALIPSQINREVLAGKNKANLVYFKIQINKSKIINVCFPSDTKFYVLISTLPIIKDDYEICNESGESLKSMIDKRIDALFTRAEGNTEANPISLIVTSPGNLVDINKAYYKRTTLIGAIDFTLPNKFGLYVYDYRNNTLKHNDYRYSEYQSLLQFNSFSAYCNALDSIYISGGDYQFSENSKPERTDMFVEINLLGVPNKIYPKELPKLKYRRNWHSMIYIPDTYIYIVGGVPTQYVEVYDIAKKSIYIDSQLNKSRCECSLALMNNKYLYAICGYNNSLGKFNDTIERCDIYKFPHRWDLVNINFGGIQFEPSFFGVSYLKNQLVLLGGKEDANGKPSYLLQCNDSKEDTITAFPGCMAAPTDICIYKEKFFIPLNEKMAGCLVMNAENFGVQLLFMDTGNVQAINF